VTWPAFVAIAAVVALGVIAAVMVAARPGSRARRAARHTRDGLVARYDRLERRWGRVGATATWLVGGLALLIAVTTIVGLGITGLSPAEGAGFDLGVTEWVARRRGPTATTVMQLASDVSDTITIVVVGLVVGAAWRWRRGDWAGLVVLAASFGGAVVLYTTAKELVARARPSLDLAVAEVAGLAFPSGHTTGGAAFWGALALLVATLSWRWVVTGAVVGTLLAVVVLTAMSRVYLAAHWVTDVIAGGLAGSTWAILVATLLWARRTPDPGP
jgi:undecaprenyl-diphosphatase